MTLVFIDHDRGNLDTLSLQAIAFARKINTSVAAVLIGQEAEPLAQTLKQHGISKAYLVTHEQLDDYAPAVWAQSVVQIAQQQNSQTVLAPSTDRGNEVLAHVAAITDQPLCANCAEVQPGDTYQVTRLRWGSSLLEQAHLKGNPKLLTVAQHVVEAQETPAADIAIEPFTPTLEEKELRVKVTRRDESRDEGISLKTASLVVCGGRGVGSAEGFSVLEALAAELGGVVGGSRVATNNGWRPHSDQVGLTGNRIAPQLYIACGISGAIQHLVGCKGAKNILVINKDREAPFFAKADYGIVGDLHEVVPALITAIRKEKG